MRTIRFRVAVSAADTVAAVDRVTDFARYPELSPDVHSVAVHPATPDGRTHSTWAMNFRRGVMRWTEWEHTDRDSGRVDFTQTDGDFDEFRGHWQLCPTPGGTQVLLVVHYDFGIESLAGIMDPIAERVIKRSALRVLSGLFGQVTVLEGGAALHDLADAAPAAHPSP
ncbi:MAG: type II toxin-antitoxin system RatA family toxin [Pseudonocardiaceae bacterium]